MATTATRIRCLSRVDVHLAAAASSTVSASTTGDDHLATRLAGCTGHTSIDSDVTAVTAVASANSDADVVFTGLRRLVACAKAPIRFRLGMVNTTTSTQPSKRWLRDEMSKQVSSLLMRQPVLMLSDPLAITALLYDCH